MKSDDFKLGDLITLKRGYDLPESARMPGDYPIVSSSGITGTHAEFKVESPGVVTGRYGTLGEVFYIPSRFWPLNTSLYVQDFKGNEPRFVSYYLQTILSANFNAAGAVPGVNRNTLHKLRVPRPPKDQKKIAAILSAYDDLIENNKRRIALLEKMAEEIYREWFVRLRFPGHGKVKLIKGVPQGWEQKRLPELADITYGFPFDGSRFNDVGLGKPIIRIRNIPESSTTDYTEEVASDKYIVHQGDLLVGMDGEFHINHWHGDDAYLVQRVCRIKAKNRLLEGYLAHAIRAPIKHFESILMGATVGHLGAIHLKSIALLVPPDSLHERLHILNDVHRQKLVLARVARNLSETRDLLLPRLISGKLSVENLDIQFPPGMAEELQPEPTAAVHA